jgi:hypothetical protein
MTLLNPAYGIILPFLFICTLPLAVFATFTTFVAFSILLFRVILVYIELGLAVIPYYLLGLKTTPKPSISRTKSFTSPGTVPGVRRRKRRSSTSSNLSGGTITPVPGDTGLGLSQSIGATRDFEGVGGWRIGDPSDDDALWTNINSRLELPAHHERRHHRRSLTSGSVPGEGRKNYREGSPEAVMNTSRARTPPSYGAGTVFAGDGYFPQVPTRPRLKRSASGITGTSNSSSSSKGSSVLGMKQR